VFFIITVPLLYLVHQFFLNKMRVLLKSVHFSLIFLGVLWIDKNKYIENNFHQIFSSIPIGSSCRNSFINSGGALYVCVSERSLLWVHFIFFFGRTYCNCLISTECPPTAHCRYSCGTCAFCLSEYLYFVDGLGGYKATNCSRIGWFCTFD